MNAFTLEPLLELFDDDPAEVGSLLSTACRSIAEDIAHIRTSIANHDADDAGERAHRIKGTSAAIGARAVCAAASSLEERARDAASAEAGALLETLVAAAEELSADVSRFRTASLAGRSMT